MIKKVETGNALLKNSLKIMRVAKNLGFLFAFENQQSSRCFHVPPMLALEQTIDKVWLDVCASAA